LILLFYWKNKVKDFHKKISYS